MSEHQARIRWERQPAERFVDLKYSRAHAWQFDGGAIVPASSSEHAVPLPYSVAENVDPEEAFVAAVSSCHMLTFLYLAAKQRFVVDSYEDASVGGLAKNSRGRLAMTTVRLSPEIVFSGERVPTDAEIENLHHAAHEECYIANSVLTTITVRGKWRHRST